MALRAEEKVKGGKKGAGEVGEGEGEGGEKKSDEALREAVMTFPWVLPLLADKGEFFFLSLRRRERMERKNERTNERNKEN